MSRPDQAAQRSLQHLQEPGAGTCFTALPLARRSRSYSLNKAEFRDSVFLGYGWEIPGLTPQGFVAAVRETALIRTARMVAMPTIDMIM